MNKVNFIINKKKFIKIAYNFNFPNYMNDSQHLVMIANERILYDITDQY